MPELPEVETVRRGIEARAAGRRIVRVEAPGRRTVRRFGRESLVDGLTGATIVGVRRHGKYLVCPLDTGFAVMIHLRMSGRVLVSAAHEPRPPHTHVVMVLEPRGVGDEELRFVDPRTFGEVVAYDADSETSIIPELTRLGPDPVVDGLSRRQVGTILRSTARPVKAALLDQHLVAGIGNIYGDEILHRARVRPLRPARDVSPSQATRIHAAIHEVRGEAIEAGGSTLDDSQYVDISGSVGGYQLRHRVYGRSGEPCLSCPRGHIVSASVGGRTSSWCSFCQR